MKNSRFKKASIALISWCLFIGIGAVGGSTAMLIAPDGSILHMQGMLPYFQVLPFAEYLFQDYIFSGIALLCVNGITNLIAAGLLFAKKKAGIICGLVFGITLMAWIVIQFVIFPSNFLSTAYFIFGALQAITGYAALVFYKQETFTVNVDNYPNIGTDSKQLVVYFSRLGYTKKIALETADKTGACLYEIKALERTEGTLGFWWCGRFGMHRWEMPIEDISVDLTQFDKVTICTPIWVFRICAPVRAFCRIAKDKIKSADYTIIHFQNLKYLNAAEEMDSLLNLKATEITSVCNQTGKIISRKTLRK